MHLHTPETLISRALTPSIFTALATVYVRNLTSALGSAGSAITPVIAITNGAELHILKGACPTLTEPVPLSTADDDAGRRSYCSTCSVAFNRNHDLKRHTRIHLSVKPFPCKSCDKAFSRKDALKRHRLVKGCEAEPESKSNTEEKSPSQSKRDSESRSVSTELSPHTIAPPVYSLKGDYPYMKQDAYIKHESFIKTE
ncbi:hypothetical protein MCOR02_000614 [Pyricularia oryzae]|nr:hypothetical protein MCOR02_000614 [Pyricularia oryzae]